jgi:hypothetical protein
MEGLFRRCFLKSALMSMNLWTCRISILDQLLYLKAAAGVVLVCVADRRALSLVLRGVGVARNHGKRRGKVPAA